MKSQHTIYIILFSVLTGIIGCAPHAIITRGTSFGHCRGFCNKSLTVNNREMAYRQWENGGNGQVNTVSAPVSKDAYKALVQSLDMKTFYNLDSVIGCPDCADGGAEWVEVVKGNNRKRVTFEYGKAPDVLKTPVEQLKKLQKRVDTEPR